MTKFTFISSSIKVLKFQVVGKNKTGQLTYWPNQPSKGTKGIRINDSQLTCVTDVYLKTVSNLQIKYSFFMKHPVESVR